VKVENFTSIFSQFPCATPLMNGGLCTLCDTGTGVGVVNVMTKRSFDADCR